MLSGKMKICTLITVLLWCYQAKTIATFTTSSNNLTKKLPVPTKETFSTKPPALANKSNDGLSHINVNITISDKINLQKKINLQNNTTEMRLSEISNEVSTIPSSDTLPATIKKVTNFVELVKTSSTVLPLSENRKFNKELAAHKSATVAPDETLKRDNKTENKGTVEPTIVNLPNKSKNNPAIVNKELKKHTQSKTFEQKPQMIKTTENPVVKSKATINSKEHGTLLKQKSLLRSNKTMSPVNSTTKSQNKTFTTKKYQLTTENPSSELNKNKSMISSATVTSPMIINSSKNSEKVTKSIVLKTPNPNIKTVNSSDKSIAQHSASEVARFSAPIVNSLQERADALGCDMSLPANDMKIWRGNQTQELTLPMTTPENCPIDADCLPMILSWEGYAEIQSGDVLLVRIDDKQLMASESVLKTIAKRKIDRDERPHHSASQTAVYQVTRPGHANCDVTEGILLDITPLIVDGKKLVTLYDKDLTEGVNLLIVVSELWGNQCIRLNVTVKSDNCGENQDCSQKGLCFSNSSMESYECQCCPGFIGSHCEERDACHLSPCTNNGICVDVSQGPDGSTYQCLCPYGFSGLNCEYEYNECDSSPCMNGAICSDLVNGYNCLCKQGFMGQRCEIKVDLCNPNPCSKNRLCIDHGNNFSCECPKGLYGLECLQPTRAACSDNICANGGTCWSSIDSFYCACRPGYTGKVCEDEFIVEAVADQDVDLGPHQNHFHNNIYVAAGTLFLAITIVGLVVAACHCRVNKTYRKLLRKANPLLRQRSTDSDLQNESENQNQQHWLTEKPVHVARPLDYDMFYALDFGESQSSPLIQ